MRPHCDACKLVLEFKFIINSFGCFSMRAKSRQNRVRSYRRLNHQLVRRKLKKLLCSRIRKPTPDGAAFARSIPSPKPLPPNPSATSSASV